MDLVHNSTFEEELTRKRKLIYTNVGDSMMPLLRQGKDLLIIERPKEWDVLPYEGSEDTVRKLKRLDVRLDKGDNGA